MSTKFVTLRLGIKKNITDGLLIYIPLGSKTAMITSQNKFAASPVIVSRENIKSGTIKYIFINSGNANACTGIEGIKAVEKTINKAADFTNLNKDNFFVSSTGIIGIQLDVNKITNNFDFNFFVNIECKCRF